MGDVVVEVDGRKEAMSPDEFVAHFYQRKKSGERVALAVVRAGERRDIAFALPGREAGER